MEGTVRARRRVAAKVFSSMRCQTHGVGRHIAFGDFIGFVGFGSFGGFGGSDIGK